MATKTDKIGAQEQPQYIVKTSGQPAATPVPVFYDNPVVNEDIAAFRAKNPEFVQEIRDQSRAKLENGYLFKIMKRGGYEPTIHPEKDIAEFRQANPLMNARVEAMPRERLENDFVLQQMRTKEGYDPDIAKWERFVNKPENAEFKKQLERSVAHIRKPDWKRRIMFKEKAPQLAKFHGIKLGL